MSKQKNPAAVALGRLGGSVRSPKKGFGSRSREKAQEAGRMGAKARWGKRKVEDSQKA